MAKKKEMNRTSGTAKRKVDTAGKLLTSKEVGTAVKKGAPITGSASGVKSISLKQAGEVLTQGIVTLGKKGLQMDPAGLAMALPFGKVFNAAKALRGAGKIAQATGLEARLGAKTIGKRLSSTINFYKRNFDNGRFPVNSSVESRMAGAAKRRIESESIYPRAKFDMNPLAKAEYKSGAKEIARSKMAEGTLNIVDTRRMNPAQAKSALEGGVSQTAKIARRIPGKEKPVRGATARLLKGRGK